MMKSPCFCLTLPLLILSLLLGTVLPGAALTKKSRIPYLGAIVVDAKTGEVIAEDHADTKGYPASMVKLMNLLVILDAVRAHHISLSDPVRITAKVSRMGGSQVYLKENEVFSVEALIYAMMVQSANDAALALALHYTGSEAVFVDMMNQKAKKLGMKDTVFHSVHGLPPSGKAAPDVTTARDMAKLSWAVVKYPEALKYTSTQVREFRPDAPEPFIMRNHNHLLKNFDGCDGLKTGYFSAAGFSIAATARKNDVRAIAVVLGSSKRKERDKQARLLLSKGLMEILTRPVSPTTAAEMMASESAKAMVPQTTEDTEADYVRIPKGLFKLLVAVNMIVIFLLLVTVYSQRRRRIRRNRYS